MILRGIRGLHHSATGERKATGSGGPRQGRILELPAAEYRLKAGTAAPSGPVAPILYSTLDSFIKTRPLTISAAASSRMGVAASPRTVIPTRSAPTAPMPVHTV